MHAPTFAMLAMAAYVGPDQILPFASALAAIGGAIMLFGRSVAGYTRRLFGRLFRR